MFVHADDSEYSDLDGDTECTYMEKAIVGGIHRLWQKKLLLDYTIKVEKQTFHAHKLVLAAVSGYFRIMVTSDFKECNKDFVEVKGISAAAMEALIKFMYTSELVIDFDNCTDILAAATFLQIISAIDACSDFLSKNINIENYLDVLAIAKRYSLEFIEMKVMRYIENKGRLIFKAENYKQFQVKDWDPFFSCWRETEWDLFMYIRNWINFAPEERSKHLNTLMHGVRFALMTPSELQNIPQMSIYKDSKDNEWLELVKGAMVYHNMPVWEKVYNQTDQSCLRCAPRPVAFTLNTECDGIAFGSECFQWQENGKGDEWRHHSFQNQLPTCCMFASVAVVENFLVAAGGYDLRVPSESSKQCYIFDPRTMVWSRIADFNYGRVDFPLIVYNQKLYALGGCIGDSRTPRKEPVVTSRCEVYDFKTNSWTETFRLPMAMNMHVACFYKDCIYISSRYRGTDKEVIDGRCHFVPNQFECFDFSCGQWQTKAPMLEDDDFHSLFPLNVRGAEVIMAAGWTSSIHYYEPVNDQWTKCTFKMLPYEEREIPFLGRTISDGSNVIYFLDDTDEPLEPVICGRLQICDDDYEYSDSYFKGPDFPDGKDIQIFTFLSFPNVLLKSGN